MDHVAIMRKDWGLIPKILSGEKKIESRWSKNKIAPWDKVKTGDTVYFKNAGETINVKVRVGEVLQFDNLNPDRVRGLLYKWGGKDGIAAADLEKIVEWVRDKKYCVLVFLDNPERIEPFQIKKTGFGNGAAWLCVGEIEKIKYKNSAPRSGFQVQPRVWGKGGGRQKRRY